jgi:hypothetical protein
MTTIHRIIAAAALLATAAWAHAVVSDEEAKALGTTLTPFGAEKTGNSDGTIPEYSGGLTTPPASYKPGSGMRPDPYAGDKPLFSIDAKNLDKYADKLTEGAKAMMKKYPAYRIDVYPTHRSAAFPAYVLDHSVKNATRCKTIEDGLGLDSACYGGIPFPIPKAGIEVMWNLQAHFNGPTVEFRAKTSYVDASGRVVLAADFNGYVESPYYYPDKTSAEILKWQRGDQLLSRNAGNAAMFADYLNPVATGRRAWSYSPGQRRVRVSPDFAYDTPTDSSGGVQVFDEASTYSGKMDRFDFKLVGKKEVYMPYNSYKLYYDSKLVDILKPNFVNPDLNRFELHRVWVVEATLKPGKRHIYSKRVFYLDEDQGGVMAETYDASGKLWRVIMNYTAPSYEVPAPLTTLVTHYDLVNGIYVLISHTGEYYGVKHPAPRPSKFWTPDSLAGSGIR